MKPQDYIHYYIGCKLQRLTKSGEIDYVKLDAYEYYRISQESYPYSIKPILRRLLDITDEEWDEIEQATSITPIAQGYGVFKEAFLNGGPKDRYHWVITNEAFIELRKRGVDVDGLIENSLAIDSKTLK